MQISKLRLKEIVKEELMKLNEMHQETSKIDEAQALANQLGSHILPKDTIGQETLGKLIGILAEIGEEEWEQSGGSF